MAAKIDIRFSLFVDGDQWCALMGKDLQTGTAGFGRTKAIAISDMFNNYKLIKGWICKDCGDETNHFWPDTHRGDIGRCNTCFFIHQAKEHPAPKNKLTMKKLVSGYFEGFFIWPHKYIPMHCPYCNDAIKHIHVGSYRDHSCHENVCQKCQVYFGFTS